MGLITFSFKKCCKVIQYAVPWKVFMVLADFIHSYNQQEQTIVEVIEIWNQFNLC
jgi:hypothetical protein